MTNSSLPSTLVKCLYLFFDLPILTNVSNDPDVGIDSGGASVSGAGSSTRLYSPKERRLLLQKMFIQVLLKLCTYQPAVEELARKDDLTLLFSAVTSECPPHNVMWRKTAADILLTISRHSLNQPVVAYLHGKYLSLNSWNWLILLTYAYGLQQFEYEANEMSGNGNWVNFAETCLNSKMREITSDKLILTKSFSSS